VQTLRITEGVIVAGRAVTVAIEHLPPGRNLPRQRS
jgi:hypothetical protein